MLLKFVLGQHEPISVLADAIYAAQMAKKVGVYGGDFADVELSADEVAFISKLCLPMIILCCVL